MIRKFRIALAGALVAMAHIACRNEISHETERDFSSLNAALSLDYELHYRGEADPEF